MTFNENFFWYSRLNPTKNVLCSELVGNEEVLRYENQNSF